MSERAETAQRLEFETGILAGRLFEFLERVFPRTFRDRLFRARRRISDGREFLRSAFNSAAGGRLLEEFNAGPLSRRSGGSLQPIDRLAEAMALSPIEVELLLLVGMPEQHEGFAAVFRALHPRGESRPSAGLAAQLFCETADERFDFRTLLESGPAVTGGALRVTGDSPFFERSLELAPGLWAALAGIDAWPASVPLLSAPIVLTGLDEWFASPAVARAAAAIARRDACTVLVLAETEDAAFHRALALVTHSGCEPAGLALPPHVDGPLEQLIRIHALARGIVPVMRIGVLDGPGTAEAPQLLAYPDTAVLCARPGGVQVRGARPLVTVIVDRLSSSARRRMWCSALPSLAEQSAHLAARYPVEPAVAAGVAADLEELQLLESRPASLEDAATAIRARAGLALTGGVKLVTPTASWDDLVLPKDRRAQLREACDRLILQDRVLDDWRFLEGRPGARGVRVLFAGPSGTGKTLSAEVVAHSLGVDMLYVDISRVVSKWIGETEKNLASLFETAERAQAVLFFDEADALFGKRTEVSDAHDRYANLETAYLLSRLERFEGLAILATNLRQNIDPAFIRRLEFAIDFDAPDREERLALWQVHVPRDAPLAGDVDLGEFAAIYPVVGAFIRNAAVAAGFLAASNGGVITRGHFLHAIRREYGKAGRAFPGAPSASATPNGKGISHGYHYGSCLLDRSENHS